MDDGHSKTSLSLFGFLIAVVGALLFSTALSGDASGLISRVAKVRFGDSLHCSLHSSAPFWTSPQVPRILAATEAVSMAEGKGRQSFNFRISNPVEKPLAHRRNFKFQRGL